MTPVDPRAAKAAVRPVPAPFQLPSVDVRTRQNERALRGWSESSRRAFRGIALVTADLAGGFLGLLTVAATWSLVSGGGRRPVPDQVPLVAMVICLQPLALRVFGAYGGGRARTDALRIAAGVAAAGLLGWIQARLFGAPVASLPNKAAYLYSALVIGCYIWTGRYAIDRLVAGAYRAGWFRRRVVVVGSAEEADEIGRRALETVDSDVQVVARLGPEGLIAADSGEGLHVPYAGDVGDLEETLSRTGAQEVVMAASLPFHMLERVAGSCFRIGATVSILPQHLKKMTGTRLEVRQTPIGAFLQLRPVRLALPQLAVKRSMDMLLAAAALVVTSPLLLAIAAAIRLESRGPIMFRQTRAGVGGRPFYMLKFRTMVDGADADKGRLRHLNESQDPRLFKIKNDPRVTTVGRLLRRLSLDELPQLFNVLLGDMSLVGPRPFFPGDLAQYERHHFERLHVLPGITGLWQVSGRSDITDFEEVIRLDREYIENWTVLSDFTIMARTVPAMLRRGAY